MAKKRKADEAPPPALWKDTFADLMNLLLCFFVMLFSMSTVEQEKFEQVAQSLNSAFSIFDGGAHAIEIVGIGYPRHIMVAFDVDVRCMMDIGCLDNA